MSQLALTEFMADFTISFMLRIMATITGGLIGLVTWYIGSGSGPGNHYGVMAAALPGLALLMYFRVFAPMQYMQAGIMGGATFALVVGYSWDEQYDLNKIMFSVNDC